jgi:iron complex outermembrane receptor protein
VERQQYVASWILAACLTCGGAARAQTVPAATTSPTDSGSEGLQEVVVTARRRDENLQRVPVAVTAFSADALSEHNVTSVENLGA